MGTIYRVDKRNNRSYRYVEFLEKKLGIWKWDRLLVVLRSFFSRGASIYNLQTPEAHALEIQRTIEVFKLTLQNRRESPKARKVPYTFPLH